MTYNLTNKARIIIGKELGINDVNSPILKSNKRFTDRANLLEPFNYIRNLVNVYQEELKSFKSENDYIKFIEESEKELYNTIEENLDITLKLEDALRKKWFKPIPILKTDILTPDFEEATMLEINLGENVIYEAIKFKIMHDKLPFNQKDFIAKHCKCRYLVERNKLELCKFSEFYQLIIKLTLDEISNMIMSKVSTVINNKQLLHVGDGRAVYSIQSNIRVGTLTDLHKVLSIESFSNLGLEINTYKLEKPSSEANLLYKKYSDGRIDIVSRNQAEYLSFMRYLSNNRSLKETYTEVNKDDQIIEVNNIYCKLSKQPGIKWEMK